MIQRLLGVCGSLLLASSVAAQNLAPVAVPAVSATTPGLAAPVRPDVVPGDLPYEAQVVAAEKVVRGYTEPGYRYTEQADNPAVGYAELFEQWEKSRGAIGVPDSVATAQRVPPKNPPPPGGNPGTMPTTAGYIAADAAAGAASGPAAMGMAVLAGAFVVLDQIAGNPNRSIERKQRDSLREQEQETKEQRDRRRLTLVTPSLTFVRKAPGATTEEAMYAEIRAATRFVAALDLRCEPAILHAAEAGPAFYGQHFSGDTYNRKFVCGFGPDEKLTAKQAVAEGRVLAVVALRDSEPVVRFALANMATMSRLKQMLPGVADDELARATFAWIKHQIPADWVAVYTAPNQHGVMTVYAARGDTTVEFPPLERH